MRKFTLHCPDGWSYVSWQRCYFTNEEGTKVTTLLYGPLQAFAEKHLEDYEYFYLSLQPNECFFVQSGESFSIEDFAESLEAMYKEETGQEITIEVRDGDIQ